jgi:hypothetical protein
MAKIDDGITLHSKFEVGGWLDDFILKGTHQFHPLFTAL